MKHRAMLKQLALITCLAMILVALLTGCGKNAESGKVTDTSGGKGTPSADIIATAGSNISKTTPEPGVYLRQLGPHQCHLMADSRFSSGKVIFLPEPHIDLPGFPGFHFL